MSHKTTQIQSQAVNNVQPYYYMLQGVDMKVSGVTTSFGTVPVGKTFVPTGSRVVTKTITALVLGPTLSIGSNASTYNDIAAGASIALAAITKIQNLPSLGNAMPAGTDIRANISLAANAGAFIADIIIEGYLI